MFGKLKAEAPWMHYFQNRSAWNKAVTLVMKIFRNTEQKIGIYNYSEKLFAVPQGNGKDLQTISPKKIILSEKSFRKRTLNA